MQLLKIHLSLGMNKTNSKTSIYQKMPPVVTFLPCNLPSLLDEELLGMLVWFILITWADAGGCFSVHNLFLGNSWNLNIPL